jgi:hypothetical protein
LTPVDTRVFLAVSSERERTNPPVALSDVEAILTNIRFVLPLLLAACATQTDAEGVWPGERFDSLPTGESQAAMPPNVTMCKPVHAIPGEMASVTVSVWSR